MSFMPTCYQCDRQVHIFLMMVCSECTRLSVDEVTGDYQDEERKKWGSNNE
jgi:hypothetical protein